MLNNKTRIDVSTGKECVLDQTLISNNLTPMCNWNVQVYQKETIGSDHCRVLCKVNISTSQTTEEGRKWVFDKGDWEKFQKKK